MHISVFTINFKYMLTLYARGPFLQVLARDFLSTFCLQSVTDMQEWWKRISQIHGNALFKARFMLVLVMPSSSKKTEASMHWAAYFPLMCPFIKTNQAFKNSLKLINGRGKRRGRGRVGNSLGEKNQFFTASHVHPEWHIKLFHLYFQAR